MGRELPPPASNMEEVWRGTDTTWGTIRKTIYVLQKFYSLSVEEKMCELVSWCQLDQAGQAAWVQAIGSVLAIFVAILVPIFTSWSKAKEQQKLRREQMLNVLLQIFDPLTSLYISLDEFHAVSDPSYDHENPLVSVDPNEGNFREHIPPLIAMMYSLNDMGHTAPDMRRFLLSLIDLDRYFKTLSTVERSGGASFRNSIDDVRERVADVKGQAGALLDQIKITLTTDSRG